MNDMKVFKSIPKDQCYPTIQDALAFDRKKKSNYVQSNNFM